MAEKESQNLSYSQKHAGDEFFTLCCTPCSKKKLNKEAFKYCPICKEYFCVSCVETHNSFNVLAGHTLVDPTPKESSSSGSSEKTQAVPTELCKKHHLKLVDMYCGNHDSVGCSVCFTLDHKPCNDIHYIPEYVQSNFSTEHIKQINNKLTEAIKSMTTLKSLHDRQNDHLNKSKAICKQEIKKYREDINYIIDQIEASTLAELDARFDYTKKKIGGKSQSIHDTQDEMVRFKSEMESDQTNNSQKFVIAKLSQHMITQGDHMQTQLHNNQTAEIKFTRNTEIMSFLLNFVTIGNLSSLAEPDSSTATAVKAQLNETKSTTTCMNPPEPGDNRNSPRQKGTKSATNPKEKGLYTIVDKSEHSIQEDDKNTCSIEASCVLEDGNILMADRGNNKLKLLDGRTYKVKSSLAVCASPWSVCRVSKKEAAACLHNLTIQFVSTGDKLVPTRSLKMNHFCRCIDINQEKMFVCESRSVIISSLKGDLVKTISNDDCGKDTFKFIYDIAVSDDGKAIHVADYYNGVITLDMDGKVLWKYAGIALRSAGGVCTDGKGNVLVCGAASHNIIQLGPSGRYLGEIAEERHGVSTLYSFCYDRNNHKLIAANFTDNDILVFTLK